MARLYAHLRADHSGIACWSTSGQSLSPPLPPTPVIAKRIEAIGLKSCAAEAAPQRTLSGSESSASLGKRVKTELSPVRSVKAGDKAATTESLVGALARLATSEPTPSLALSTSRLQVRSLPGSQRPAAQPCQMATLTNVLSNADVQEHSAGR